MAISLDAYKHYKIRTERKVIVNSESFKRIEKFCKFCEKKTLFNDWKKECTVCGIWFYTKIEVLP